MTMIMYLIITTVTTVRTLTAAVTTATTGTFECHFDNFDFNVDFIILPTAVLTLLLFP